MELPSELLEDLEAGGTVVVPTRQRAAALRLAHAARQVSLERKLWRTPDIHPWSSWLEREALRATEAGKPIPRVLRSTEEWLLWRSVVKEATRDSDLLLGDSLISALRRSAQLLHDWRIPMTALRLSPSLESELLERALHAFESRCADLQATASYRLPELLQGWKPGGALSFAGFTESTPARAQSTRHWREQGAYLRDRGGGRHLGSASIACTDSPEEEIELAAQWCRDQLEADPSRRLLVIVPDLAQRRHAVLRAFEEALAPQGILGTAPCEPTACFAIEGGQPLTNYPLVQQALSSLRLLIGRLQFPTLSSWLRSSFWRAPEAADRARLELWLRGRLTPEIDLQRLCSELDTVPSALQGGARVLLNAISEAQGALDPRRGPSNAADWSRRFNGALAALGWPGSRPLSSAEQQTRMRFCEALDELANLTSSLGPLDAAEALRALTELVGRVAFEPATGDPAVTLTDAVADPIVRYDGMWVAGLHADVWPRPRRFDPFIPLAAQRDAGVAMASNERLLQEARKLLALWQRSATQLVVSWPRRGADCDYIASPLLNELSDAQPWSAPRARLALARATRHTTTLESCEDGTGVPWPVGQSLPSGTRSIEYQARCAFRAYAELRLACAPLETPRPGVDMRDRGRLLHRALELLWKQLRDLDGLRARQGEQLESLIAECVERALEQSFNETELREQRRALERERRRAIRLIGELCALEREREPFRVRGLEMERKLSVAGAPLEVRIDRVDELADGTVAIFDYKTGKPQSQDWLGERASNPQLLVYLLALQERVSALATVHLAAGRVSYRGIADQKGRLPKVSGLPADGEATAESIWQEQLGHWQRQIEQLARDFLDGRAAIDPVEQACRVCHLHSLCRIADLAPAEPDEDDGGHD